MCCFFNQLKSTNELRIVIQVDCDAINFPAGDNNLLRLKYVCWEQK
jgi:hypothetical protein